MKRLILSILLIGPLSFTAEKADHEIFLEAMQGKWATTVSGNLIVNEQEPKSLHYKGQTSSKLLYGKFIFEHSLGKGKNFEGVDLNAESYEVRLFDKKNELISCIYFNSDSGIFVQQFKVQSSDKVSLVSQRKGDQKEQGYFEFLKSGKERVGLYLMEDTLMGGFQLNMNWLSIKVDKFDKPLKPKEVKEVSEKIKKYKTDDHKWVLQSKYLRKEVKKDKKYVEIIGELITRDQIRKYQFHEDGSVKAFIPEENEGKLSWKEVDYIYKIPNQ